MRETLTRIATRRLMSVVTSRLAEEPVLVLNGPRTVGKSTLLRQLAAELDRPVIDCDDPETRLAVRDDPGRFTESGRLVLINEYQHVPRLLSAIKTQLSHGPRPGRYLLAGSARYRALTGAGRALTGRAGLIPVLPLSQGEIDGVPETFIARLLAGDGIDMTLTRHRTTRGEYALRATSGGMPLALRRPPGPSRSRWYSSYVDLVIDEDVAGISRVRRRDLLPPLLGQLAARSAEVLNVTRVSGAAGMERTTAENYINLLDAVFLVRRLPAWGTTLGPRIARHPKLHLVDSGVMAWLLNLTPARVTAADPGTLRGYRQLIETFTVGEILKQASWTPRPVRAGYFRTETGAEVDLVLERDDGTVTAFQVKAGTHVGAEDLRGFRKLRDRIGDRLSEAIVLYLGEHAYTRDGWVTVVPLDRLWT